MYSSLQSSVLHSLQYIIHLSVVLALILWCFKDALECLKYVWMSYLSQMFLILTQTLCVSSITIYPDSIRWFYNVAVDGVWFFIL